MKRCPGFSMGAAENISIFCKKTIDFLAETEYNTCLHGSVHATISSQGGVTVPNIKSAKKRVELSKVANARNKAGKSALKTDIKKFDAAVLEGNREAADAAYKAAVKAVDQAVNKGLLHKNTAARKKSSMTLKLNKLA